MNDSAYINVYHTINPSKFYSYGTYISKVCFGLVPGTTDEYSFISNPITGHFIYKVSSKYLMPSSNPQNESEARNCLAEILSNLRDKISAAKNSKSLPEDFPVLFNNSHISTMNIAPVYDGQNTNIITSWKAVLGIELKVFNSLKSAKSMLESDSIIIEFSGKRIIEMDYNYTPIVKREEYPICPNENSEFVYKKVNANTIAPYYLTAEGYIPACVKSIPVFQKPVSYGWSSPQPTHDSCKSMLTWSDIVEPTEDHPGSAKLVISMDYKVVTTGEGAVDVNLINPKEFNRLFKLGNFPGEKNTGHLLLKRLPTIETKAVILMHDEIQKIDEGIAFYDYYKISVEYDYKLIKEANCSLWDALKWMHECLYSRGLICVIPFEQEFITYYNLKLRYADNDNSNDFDTLKKEIEYKILIKLTKYLLKNIICDNIEYYRNQVIYDFNLLNTMGDYICNDSEINTLLQSINSYFYNKSGDCNDAYVTVGDLYEKRDTLLKLNNVIFQSIEKLCNGKAGGAACIGHPNCIVLSPHYFSVESKSEDDCLSITRMEIIAHEAGHNSAAAFSHSENYDYKQKGLQSYRKGWVYPTDKNTTGIIDDDDNRKHMTIK